MFLDYFQYSSTSFNFISHIIIDRISIMSERHGFEQAEPRNI